MLDFTQAEKRTLLIVITILTISSGIQFINSSMIPPQNLDYFESDSIFSRRSHSIPHLNQTNDSPQLPLSDFYEKSTNAGSSKSKKSILVNINTASNKEFQQLPRIGPAMAKRIIEYRKTNGPFEKNKELLKIKGIGPKTYEKLKPFLQDIN
jgi:comEA protein